MADTVWIQAGSIGFRWANDDRLEANLAEWEQRYVRGRYGRSTYAIHDGDCQLGKTNDIGCTCTPQIRSVIPVEVAPSGVGGSDG